MLVKNWGAAWTLVGLVAIASVGLAFFEPHYCYENCPSNAHQSSINQYHGPGLVSISDWLKTSDSAISAVLTIATLLFTAVIAIFTAVLADKTGGLYTQTYALREIQDQQRSDMLRSIKATERSAKVAEDALRISAMPKIVISDIRMVYFMGEKIRIVFGCKNSGKGACVISELKIFITTVDKGNPNKITSIDKKEFTTNQFMEVGDDIPESTVNCDNINREIISKIYELATVLDVAIQISLLDIFNNRIEKSFLFTYDHIAKQFRRGSLTGED
jgi:hypothetical protein